MHYLIILSILVNLPCLSCPPSLSNTLKSSIPNENLARSLLNDMSTLIQEPALKLEDLSELAQIVGVYPRDYEKLSQLQQLFEESFHLDAGDVLIKSVNEQLKKESLLGQGNAAWVYKSSPGTAYKIPRDAEGIYKLQVEMMVNKDLEEHFDDYGIHTLKILEGPPEKPYLVKPFFEADNLASNILKNGTLIQIQKRKLEELWRAAVRYAEYSGIALDLKADNLFWDSNRKVWVLLDTGPRFAYRPYGYTADLDSFDQYLKTWNLGDPIFSQKYHLGGLPRKSHINQKTKVVSLTSEEQEELRPFLVFLEELFEDKAINPAKRKKLFDRLKQACAISPSHQEKVTTFLKCAAKIVARYPGLLTIEEFESLKFYSDNGFKGINSSLRHGSLSPFFRAHINQLDGLFKNVNRLASPITVKRITEYPEEFIQEVENHIGKTMILDSGYSSTTARRTYRSATQTNIIIKTKHGLPIALFSTFPREAEVLLPRGHPLKIHDVLDAKKLCRKFAKVPREGMESFSRFQVILACDEGISCGDFKNDLVPLVNTVCQ